MSQNGIFSPPTSPGDGEGYTFGNIVWRYEADNGVWNIVDGSLAGSQGPKGDKGDKGDPGDQGSTGATGEPIGFRYTYTTATNPPGSGQIYYSYAGTQPLPLVLNLNTQDSENLFGMLSSFIVGSLVQVFSENSPATRNWYGVISTATPVGDSYVTLTPFSGVVTGSSPFIEGEKIRFIFAPKGAAGTPGTNGAVGATGSTGATGATGPIGGSDGQIIFNESGSASGNANFTADLKTNNIIQVGGATSTAFNFMNRSEVYGGAFNNNQELISNITTGINSITISAGTNVQRFRVTPTQTYTVNVSSSGWDETLYNQNYLGCQTITALIQCMNGITGQFASDIYVDRAVTGDGKQGNAPVLSGVTGGVDILTIMRYSNGSTAVKIGFHVAKGMTGSGLAF